LTGPLAGVRIVDLSTVLSGPLATALLADQGAEVVKVESPEGDTARRVGPAKGDQSAMFIAANRGKRCIALDLKAAAAHPVLHALIGRADVLVENFRPGVMARLGLADAMLAERYPRLVRLSITGFGPDGPRAGDKAYDAVIQAVSGVSATHPVRATGEPDLLPTLVCDKLTALTAAQAVTAALLARASDGRGRRVQVSMLDAALAFQWPDAMYNQVFLDNPPPPFPEVGATTRPWRTADGHVATMSPQQAEFAAICDSLGRPDIAQDPRFATSAGRNHHGQALRDLLEPFMARQTTANLEAAARERHAPLGAVLSRAQVVADPQVRHNQTLVTVNNGALGRVRLARSAALFDGVAQAPSTGAAAIGAHGAELLRELGFSDDAIQALVAQRVLRLPEPR
jgi:crotonobetainyl-CoA:carnitine CoA-transferase CaiB-like acyl-CoA transferase